METSTEGSDVRAAIATLGGVDDETTVDSGLTYRTGEPVLIRIRRRGRRYDISDGGAAVAKAGEPVGWLEETERLVAADGFNVNHRGVIFVPAVEGRDIGSLTLRLAGASRSAYLTLLDAVNGG